MRRLAVALVLAAARALVPPPPPRLVAPRAAATSHDDPLTATAACIDAIWRLDITRFGPARVRMTRERDASHAQLWTKDDWDLHLRKDRYLQVLLRWPRSPLVRGVLPTVLLLVAWSYVAWSKRITVTANGLGFLASPIALLLAFRVNSCVARFHAAREVWGKMIFHARDLASSLAASADVDAETRAYACRCLVAYAWCAKAACAYDAPETLRPVLDAVLPPRDAAAVAAAPKPALAALHRLRRAVIGLPLQSHVAKSAQHAVSELNLLYGGVERTLSTPLAPMYMRHYQRGLLVWLFLLPCGLVGAGCSTAPKLALVVGSVAYLMLGIDEIGIQIENPYAVMPVHSLAAGLTRDCAATILEPEA